MHNLDVIKLYFRGEFKIFSYHSRLSKFSIPSICWKFIFCEFIYIPIAIMTQIDYTKTRSRESPWTINCTLLFISIFICCYYGSFICPIVRKRIYVLIADSLIISCLLTNPSNITNQTDYTIFTFCILVFFLYLLILWYVYGCFYLKIIIFAPVIYI